MCDFIYLQNKYAQNSLYYLYLPLSSVYYCMLCHCLKNNFNMKIYIFYTNIVIQKFTYSTLHSFFIFNFILMKISTNILFSYNRESSYNREILL